MSRPVAKAQPITYRRAKEFFPFLALFGSLYLLSQDPLPSQVPGPLADLIRTVQNKAVSPWVAATALKWTVNIHIAEALAMSVYVKFVRGADVGMTLKWGLTQLVAGFPNYLLFRKVNN